MIVLVVASVAALEVDTAVANNLAQLVVAVDTCRRGLDRNKDTVIFSDLNDVR